MTRQTFAGLTLVGAALLAAVGCGSSDSSAPTSTTAPSTTAVAGTVLWPLPADPQAAITAAGLAAAKEEGQAVHYHSHLDVVVNGKPVMVPANIGITRTGISPLHTHQDVDSDPQASTGVVHIEADKADTFTLGQLFTEWGVPLTRDCVGTYCTDAANELRVYVNGKQVADPASVPFGAHDQITLWFGPRGAKADVASSYDFPQGE